MSASERPPLEEFERRYERERRARFEAEAIAESATRRLYDLVVELEESKAELQRMLTAQREFVTIAAHELQTPVAPIAAFAEMLVSHWDETPDDEKLRRVAAIERQAQRLRRLTTLMLGLSRIEAGTLQVRPKVVNLKDVLATLVRETSEGRFEVAVRCPRSLTAHADPDHIQTILSNLIENAFKHGSPPFGVDAHGSTDWAEIRVRDGGEGVPEEFVPRLFDKFAQARFGANNDPSGVGLGLYLVRNLARAQGGEAWYEPNHPRGACLAVRLPAVETGAEPSQRESGWECRSAS